MSVARKLVVSASAAAILGVLITSSFVLLVSPRGGIMSTAPSATGYLVSTDEAIEIAHANGLGISLPSQMPGGVELKAVLLNPMTSTGNLTDEIQLTLLYGLPTQTYPNGTIDSRLFTEIGRNVTRYTFGFRSSEVPLIVTAYLTPTTPVPQVDANLTQWANDLNDGPLGKAGLGKAWVTQLSGGAAYVRTQTAGELAVSPSEWTFFDFTGEYIVMFLTTGSYSVASTLPLDETLAFAGSFLEQ